MSYAVQSGPEASVSSLEASVSSLKTGTCSAYVGVLPMRRCLFPIGGRKLGNEEAFDSVPVGIRVVMRQ